MFAKMKPLSNVKTTPFNFGCDGLNTTSPLDVKDSELTDVSNTDTRAYPSLKVRDGRSLTASITTPRMLGQRDNQYLMVLDDTAWEYYNGAAWVTLASGLAVGLAEVRDFPTDAVKYSIYSDAINRKYFDGGNVGDITQMPSTYLFTVHKGRIYALSDNDLSYCALNKPLDWASANDAGKIDITYSMGVGTGIITYNDHVIAWSIGSMHELHGTGPKNYNLIDVSRDIGCASHRSIKEVRGLLYWLGKGFIYQYGGGVKPKIVSDKVQEYIDRINWAYSYYATAGTDGQRYYLSIPIDGSSTNNKLLVYDTKTGNWTIEDGNIEDFVEIDGNLYGVDYNGKIKLMISGTSDDGAPITWYAISKVWNENTLGEKKSLRRLYFIVDLPVNSTLNIYLSNDAEGDNFTLIKSITASNNLQNCKIDVPLTVAQCVDWYRIKLSGTGPCTVHKMEKQFRVARRG